RCAATKRTTLQRCNSVAEFHAVFQILILQHSINEAGMEGIAGASRVSTAVGDLERGRFQKVSFAVDYDTPRAKRRTHDRAAIARLNFNQRGMKIAARQPLRKF